LPSISALVQNEKECTRSQEAGTVECDTTSPTPSQISSNTTMTYLGKAELTLMIQDESKKNQRKLRQEVTKNSWQF
jgi:hypothetical protein